jgi:xanthine dehydrogenase accessory factor
MKKKSDILILIKGAGEHSTATAHRLFRCGFRIIMTEIEFPTAVRRTVSFCSSVYQKEITVEGVTAKLSDFETVTDKNFDWSYVPVIIDSDCSIRKILKPDVLIDGRIMKRNPDTCIDDAELVIAFGPGYCAGKDCDIVIETNRGHNLGKIIYSGEPEPNTGEPGAIAGITGGRAVRSPGEGIFSSEKNIGDMIKQNEIFGYVAEEPVYASISGMIRGLIKPGLKVRNHTKIGDIDPRNNKSYCYTLSDKARAISGGTLEAVINYFL